MEHLKTNSVAKVVSNVNKSSGLDLLLHAGLSRASSERISRESTQYVDLAFFGA